MCVMSLGLKKFFFEIGNASSRMRARGDFRCSWLSAKHRASFSKASGGWAREDEEDGGKALNARQEEDGRQKPIRQPGSRAPSFSQLFRQLEDQDTARNECEKSGLRCRRGVALVPELPQRGVEGARQGVAVVAGGVEVEALLHLERS